MNRKLLDLLDHLSGGEYKTAEEIASQLNIGIKTVRVRIKELNEILAGHGAEIKSKPRYGYHLVIDSEKEFQTFTRKFRQKEDIIPATPEEREQYLLLYLLNTKEYSKMDHLSEFLYISKTSLAVNVRGIEKILNKYGLVILRRPNYGIRIEGKEYKKRICLADYFLKYNTKIVRDWNRQESEIQYLGNLLLQAIRKYGLDFSEVAFQNILIQLYISISRMKHEFYMDDLRDEMGDDTYDIEMEAAKEIFLNMRNKYKIHLPESEISYLALHLAGKRTIIGGMEERENFLVTEEIQDMVERMLNQVYLGTRTDFRKDLETRIALNQHMIPFHIRMKFDLPLKNPMLQEIKKKYMYAYTIAAQACIPLKEYYGKEIEEDEIGYFALIFALGLEHKDKRVVKKNILLVCSTGRGSSRLLAYKYQKEFGDYINKIEICDMFQFDRIDFNHIDCVFTTVPLTRYVPRPVFEVSQFLGNSEIADMLKLLKKDNGSIAARYYSEELFIKDVKGETKEEVLTNLCKRISNVIELPEDFLALVLKRESLGSTDYGNLVAIPHPIKVVTESTFVCVGILEHPILWDRNEVQVVFLVSIRVNGEELQGLYDKTMKVIMDKSNIQALIKGKSYQTLVELFEKEEA